MYQFKVTDAHTEARLIALRDSSGFHHIARATAAMPSVGTVLHGVDPVSGFQFLLCASTTRVYRVIFEQINCGPEKSLTSLDH
jgi:hypothetical protein